MQIEGLQAAKIFINATDDQITSAINGLIALLESRGTLILDGNDDNFRLSKIVHPEIDRGQFYFETEDVEQCQH